MIDIGQPCLAQWREHGTLIGALSCEKIRLLAGMATPDDCPGYTARTQEVEGGSATCPLRCWEHELGRSGARIPDRERGLLVGDMSGMAPLAPWEPLCWLRSRGKLPALTVLGGTVGTGKTYAACYWLSRQAGTRRYVWAPDVVSVKAPLKFWSRVDSLVIDQLGSEYFGDSGWGLGQFVYLIERRFADMLPTILVGNITEETFKKRYRAQVYDRLQQDGAYMQFDAPSRRGR